MKRSLRTPITVAIVLVVGVSSLVFDRGPLNHLADVGRSTWCLPIGESRQGTFGSAILDHSSRRTLKIADVGLLGADGLIVIDSLILPTRFQKGIDWSMGVIREFPPRLTEHNTGIVWEVSPAIGAIVRGDEPADLQLVFGLELDRGREVGQSVDVLLSYRAGWRFYSVRIPHSFVLTERTSCEEIG